MRVIGGFGGLVAGRRRRFGTADRGGARGRRRRWRGELGSSGLRLRAGIAAASGATGPALPALPARLVGLLGTVTRVFPRTFP